MPRKNTSLSGGSNLALLSSSDDADKWNKEVELARATLESTDDPEVIKELRARAEAIAAYAHARQSQVAAQAAARVHLLAARRAGQLRFVLIEALGGRNSSERAKVKSAALEHFDSQFGIHRNEANEWERLARVPDLVLEATVTELQRNGRTVTPWSVTRASLLVGSVSVEKGILRLADGRYRITWPWRFGASSWRESSLTLATRDLSSARSELRRRKRGKAPSRPPTKLERQLDGAYELIRRAAQGLDKALDGLCPEARTEVREALQGLHHAEDSVGSALRAQAVARHAEPRGRNLAP